MEKSVIIIVPVYKMDLDEYEKISLGQVNTVLCSYSKAFIAPQSLQFDYGVEYASWKIERFPDKYFANTETYSELCLSPEFYERFLLYQYMLIYQTDAFIFSDRLEEFCKLGFDYIGAPVPKSVWRFLGTKVGNGGLSLRKIGSVLRILKNKQDILKKASGEYSQEFVDLRLQIEDQFFAYCSTLSELHFFTPVSKLAAIFSVESDFGYAYQDLAENLPFGCHRWYQNNFSVWWPIIQKYGYQLSEEDINKAERIHDMFRLRHIRAYLFERFIRFHRNLHFSIWGYGVDGHKCIDLLEAVGIEVASIYDIHAGKIENDTCIPLRKPVDAELKLKQSIIIIATAKYESEISHHLETLGLQRNVDFVAFYPVKTYKALGCKRG